MNPVQRKSKSQSRMRRSHDMCKKIYSVRCPNCNSAKLPHAACMTCGYVRPGLKLNLAKDE